MLPVIDLSSSSEDRISTAHSIRQACTDYGFFYLINHGVDEQLLQNVFEQSRLFFSLPLEDKMKCSRNIGGDFGFSPLYAENLDSSSSSKTKGDSKETFHIGPLQNQLNQWPSQDLLPSWRSVMETYYTSLLSIGKKLSSLIALALNLDDHFFHSIGALDKPYAFLRLLHYPGEMGDSDEDGVVYGASAHSDYGMITLLATDGVPGLQVCREKLKHPRTWENVNHVKGAFIVNLGDLMERWTNCLFR
ncbi:2-oxoglutarate (2OG) and Fe(II)-dependent oxygenase superfamily protein [Artemisia annua]|nr:2-oxoglutarate (2OG) and Fe(II)-dependent oxygenase superfamily protein [Artemisia annua]